MNDPTAWCHRISSKTSSNSFIEQSDTSTNIPTPRPPSCVLLFDVLTAKNLVPADQTLKDANGRQLKANRWQIFPKGDFASPTLFRRRTVLTSSAGPSSILAKLPVAARVSSHYPLGTKYGSCLVVSMSLARIGKGFWGSLIDGESIYCGGCCLCSG